MCHPSIITRLPQLCSRDLLTTDELIKVDQKLVSEFVQKIISLARNLLCHPNYWSSSFFRLDVLLRMRPRPKESYGLMAYLLGLYSNSVEFSNSGTDLWSSSMKKEPSHVAICCSIIIWFTFTEKYVRKISRDWIKGIINTAYFILSLWSIQLAMYSIKTCG